MSLTLESACEILGELVVGRPDPRGGILVEPIGWNLAQRFENDTFALRDYCWCDGSEHGEDEDGNPNCPPNFEHYASGTAGRWYKHLGRSTMFNRCPGREEVLAIFLDCVDSLGMAGELAKYRAIWAAKPRPDQERLPEEVRTKLPQKLLLGE